jgi:F-type H+-transporting ATPase subunit b
VLALITVLAETAATDVAEATEEVKNPILPTLNEMFWALVFFLLLWALMKYVLLPPIMKVFQARADKVRDDLAAAEAAETARTTKLEQYEAELAGARAEAVALIEQARSEGDAERRSQIGAAEAVVQKPIDRSAQTQLVEDYVNRAGSQN